MSSLPTSPAKDIKKRCRIPTAFMLFVRENKAKLVQKYPEESLTAIGTLLENEWKSLGTEEKRSYHDQYKVLKEKYSDGSEDKMADSELMRELDEIKKDIPDFKISDKAFDAREPPSDAEKSKTDDSNPSFLGDCSRGLSRKGCRRGKNPYLLFAREQGRFVKSTPKNHKSTILGQMWKGMDHTQKKKYVERARMQTALQAEDAAAGPSVVARKAKKRKTKKIHLLSQNPRWGTERTMSKKNEARSKIESTVNAVASGSTSESAAVPSVSPPSEPSASHPAPQPSCACMPTSTSSASVASTHTDAFMESSSSVYRQPFVRNPVEPPMYRPSPFPPYYHSDTLAPNQAYSGGYFVRPYSYAPPDPFSYAPPDPFSYFWMYQQSISPYPPPYQSSYYHPCPHSYAAPHFRSLVYGSSYTRREEGATTQNRDDTVDPFVVVDDEQQVPDPPADPRH